MSTAREAITADHARRRAGERIATGTIDALLAGVEAAHEAGAAWLDLDLGEGARIVVVWPSAEPILAGTAKTAATPATEAPGARERLPWDHYAEPLRDELKAITTRYPASTVADAAVRLAELIAAYGPIRPRTTPPTP